jgi:tRNA A37 threonylcarbamoyladenosine synthetase subunit TsaC/SUA5/YrdC
MSVLDIKGDAEKVWQAMQAGGIAILPLDVAYGIFAQTAEGVTSIFEAKGRSFSKPSGSLGSIQIIREVQILAPRDLDIARAIVEDYDLPFSTVAPFRPDHPYFAKLDPVAIERSTKAGTLDMLINSGPLARELARLAWERQFPIMGSSANRSLSGSKFRLEDIEPEVRRAATIEIDYGLCRYANAEAISSTILSFPKVEVLRYGVCYEQIRDIIKRHFRIELPPKPAGDLITGAARGDQR